MLLAASPIRGLGGKINRYVEVGFGTGYFELKQAINPVIPLGIDLTLTDFKKKDFSCFYCSVVLCYFKQQYDEGAARYSHAYYDIKETDVRCWRGRSLSGIENKKILITGSYAKITSKITRNTSSSPPPSRGSPSAITTTANGHQDIAMLSVSLVL